MPRFKFYCKSFIVSHLGSKSSGRSSVDGGSKENNQQESLGVPEILGVCRKSTIFSIHIKS